MKKNKNVKKNRNPTYIPFKKPKVVKGLNLKVILQNIYNEVNLETTCNHNICCCKTSMPMMNYVEFIQIVTELWKKWDKPEDHQKKLNLLITSLEYFFRYDYEKWGMESLVKPCMLLDKETKLCTAYSDRPLSCRMYGLWPKEDYELRVGKFEKAYAKYGLKREDLPLSTQCPFVKRVDDSVPLTTEVINGIFEKLDKLDEKMGNFSSLQVKQKENYRTFHDWLLLKVVGEDMLVKLTTFAMAASKEIMQDQIRAIKEVWTKEFGKNFPDITKSL